ncbi:cell division protein FtsL [Galenea microaerophila]
MSWIRRFEPARWIAQRRGLFSVGLLTSLLLIVLLLAVLNVWVQHQVRHLETNYYAEMKTQQALKTEWGKLRLEQSHLTARARVQQIAEKQLHLRLEKNPKLKNLQTIYLPQNANGEDSQ